MKIIMAEHTYLDSTIKVGCHHLYEYFSKMGHEILYISTPISPFHLVGIGKNKATKRKLELLRSGGELRKDGNIEYVPFTFLPIKNYPILRSPFAIRHNLDTSLASLKKVLKKNDFMEPDLLLISDSLFHKLPSVVSAKTLIYRMTDNYSEFPDIPNTIRLAEDRLLESADHVVTTSNFLRDMIMERGREKNLHFISNGVNLDNFYRDEYLYPDEYLRYKENKKVLYMGAIESWFDADLVAMTAIAYPDVHFFIIGPVKRDISSCTDMDNVHFLGLKPFSTIPDFLYHTDVCMIPFIINSLIEGVSPIKLFEYFSLGKPVVSMFWKEINFDLHGLFTAEKRIDFVDQMGLALNWDLDGAELKEFSRENSWENKTRQLISLVDGK